MVPSIWGTIHTKSGPTNCFNLFARTDPTTSPQPLDKPTNAAYISDSGQFSLSNSPYIKFEIIALNDTEVNDT